MRGVSMNGPEREWAITYDLAGGRGRLFICTITRSGALQLFASAFPTARVVRIEAAR
jgi:hypothetical protein